MSTNATIAVTLRPVEVSGFGPRAAPVAVTLKLVAVAGAGKAVTGVGGAVSLPHPLSLAGAAVKANVGHAAVTLKHATVAASAAIGVTNTITSINPVLKHVTVSGALFHQVGNAAVTLKRVHVAGTLTKGITGSGGASITLGRVLPGIHAINKYVNLVYGVQCITGHISSTGTAIFQFRGRAGLGVTWSITTGSGSITPLGPSYTDAHGIAFAKYDSGGYDGPLVIGASYVP